MRAMGQRGWGESSRLAYLSAGWAQLRGGRAMGSLEPSFLLTRTCVRGPSARLGSTQANLVCVVQACVSKDWCGGGGLVHWK